MKIATAGGTRPPQSSKARARKIILICAIAVLVAALVLVGAMIAKYAKGADAVDRAKNLYDPTDTTSVDIWKQPELERNNMGVIKDFYELHKLNDDIIGWISIAGTKLDLPVALGDDNVYYLDHAIDKKYNAFGVPFADWRSVVIEDYQNTNVTIYGHAANDGSYFTPVKSYKNVEYYKQHPTIKFDTIYGKGEYKIIGAFMEDTRMSNPKRFAYHDQLDMNAEELATFVDNVKARSYFTTDVDVVDGDKLITLSTCDTEIDASLSTPYRIALVARKVREGESTSVNVSAAKSNTEMTMPDGWVKKKGKANPYK